MFWKKPDLDSKPVILVICTGNSCRSQIAEGLIKDRYGDRVRVYSAGSHPSGIVHPMSIEVLSEVDINIRRNKSQHWDELPVDDFDLIVTLCDKADHYCPLVPTEKGERKHIPFPDPIYVRGSQEEIRQAFRETRERIDEELLPVIEEWLNQWEAVEEE